MLDDMLLRNLVGESFISIQVDGWLQTDWQVWLQLLVQFVVRALFLIHTAMSTSF